MGAEAEAGALSRRAAWRWLAALALVGGAWGSTYRGLVSIDLIKFAGAGQAILTGRIHAVYADPWMQAGPWELLLSWVLLPLPSQHRMSYVITGQGGATTTIRFVAGAGIVLLLATTVWRFRRLAGLPGRYEPVLGAVLVGLLLRLPYQVLNGWHVAQPAIAFCWLAAAALALRGRPHVAALVLGLSCGWEPWACLALPVLLLAPVAERTLDALIDPSMPGAPAPAPKVTARASLTSGQPSDRLRRLTSLGGVFVLAAGLPYLPFLLSGHFALFTHRWAVIHETPLGLLMPYHSHFTWWLRVAQAGTTLAAGAWVAASLRGRPEAIWLTLFTVQLTRLLLDPMDLAYYYFPLLLISLVAIGTLDLRARPDGARRLTYIAGLVLLPHLPNLFNATEAPSLVAVAALLTDAVLLVMTVRLIRAEPARHLTIPDAAALTR